MGRRKVFMGAGVVETQATETFKGSKQIFMGWRTLAKYMLDQRSKRSEVGLDKK